MSPVEVAGFNEVFAFLHNKPYVLGGVSGTFVHVWHVAKKFEDDRVRLYEELLHIPDADGQQSKSYEEGRTEVGEDWVTDLSDDEASYLPIAVLLGYGEDERERGGERGSGSFGAVWSVEGARVSLKDMN